VGLLFPHPGTTESWWLVGGFSTLTTPLTTTNELSWLVGGFSTLATPSTTTNESSRLVGGFSPSTDDPSTTNESWRLVGGFSTLTTPLTRYGSFHRCLDRCRLWYVNHVLCFSLYILILPVWLIYSPAAIMQISPDRPFNVVEQRIQTLTSILQKMDRRRSTISVRSQVPAPPRHFATLVTCGSNNDPDTKRVIAITGSLTSVDLRILVVIQNPFGSSGISEFGFKEISRSSGTFDDVVKKYVYRRPAKFAVLILIISSSSSS